MAAALQTRIRKSTTVIQSRLVVPTVYGINVRGSDGAALGGIPLIDEFCGIGGNSWGGRLVPHVTVTEGYNHLQLAADSWQVNHPDANAVCADVTKYPVEQMPWCAVYCASPACPGWTDANGVTRDFDQANADQPTLIDGMEAEEDTRTAQRRAEYARSRLLMHEPLRYLRAWVRKGRPVPMGFLENVPEVWLWAEREAFIAEFHKLGYRTRWVAIRSDHARPVRAGWAPQARNRAYLVFWHESLGRTPDFDKWLRPNCWCNECDRTVLGEQTWKTPGVEMGEYGPVNGQYFYRCPNHGGRTVIAHPESRPALDILDPTNPGIAVGDPIRFRKSRYQPLVDATILRLAAGVVQQWLPLLAQHPEGKGMLPFIAAMSGGGDQLRARSSMAPLSTLRARGNHHGVTFPPDFDEAQMRAWANQLLVPYYGAARTSRPVTEPMGTLTTKDRYALARLDDWDAWQEQLTTAGPLNQETIKDLHRGVQRRVKKGTPFTAAQQRNMDKIRDQLAAVRYRILTVGELKDGMGFGSAVRSVATRRDEWVLLLGNAVTPAVPELIVSALVECLTGESLERDLVVAA